jgi:hypothetical protein
LDADGCREDLAAPGRLKCSPAVPATHTVGRVFEISQKVKAPVPELDVHLDVRRALTASRAYDMVRLPLVRAVRPGGRRLCQGLALTFCSWV